MIQRQQGLAAVLFCTVALLAGCSGPAPEATVAPAPVLAAPGQDDQGSYRAIETFAVGDAAVAAWGYNAIVAPWGRVYAFCVSAAGAPPYAIVLGSYDETTRIAREMVAIGAGERIYHLDRYEAGAATTLAMFGQPPAYENVRAMVTAAVAARPVDAATRVPLGVALAHSMIALKGLPASAQAGGPCTAQRT